MPRVSQVTATRCFARVGPVGRIYGPGGVGTAARQYRPVWGRTGAILRAQRVDAQIFFFSANALNLKIRNRLCPTKNLPFGEGKQSARPTLSDGT